MTPEALTAAGYEVAAYTGRTDAAERERLEAALLDNEVKALVATSAWMVWSALAAPSTAPENAAAGARPIDAQG